MRNDLLFIPLLLWFATNQSQINYPPLYKQLPPAFSNIFRSSDFFLTRAQIIDRYSQDRKRRKYVQQFFSLEDKLFKLSKGKRATKYLFYYCKNYDYFYADSTKEGTYLDMDDAYFTSPPPLKIYKSLDSINSIIYTARKELSSIQEEQMSSMIDDSSQTVENSRDSIRINSLNNLIDKAGTYSTNLQSIIYDRIFAKKDTTTIYRIENYIEDKGNDKILDSIITAKINTYNKLGEIYIEPSLIKEDTIKYFRGYDPYKLTTPGLPIPLGIDSLQFMKETVRNMFVTYRYLSKLKQPSYTELSDTEYRFLPESFFEKYKKNLPTFSKKEVPFKLRFMYHEYFKFHEQCIKLKNKLNKSYIPDLPDWYSYENQENKYYDRDKKKPKIKYINSRLFQINFWKDPLQNLLGFAYDTVYQLDKSKENNSLRLVYSDRFQDNDLNHFHMPSFLDGWNREALKNCINILDPIYQEKVKNVKISYDVVNKEKFWVQFKRSSETIYLSPFLERIIFTDISESHFDYILSQKSFLKKKNFNAYFENLKAHYFPNDAFRYNVNEPFNDFYLQVSFIIGHELAHSYLAGEQVKNIESLCDCYSLYYIKKNKQIASLGIFGVYLANTRLNDITKLWRDQTDMVDIRKRSLFLQKFVNPNTNLTLDFCDHMFK